MTATPQDKSPRGMAVWLRVVLFGSLALNMVVLGAALALVLGGPSGPRAPEGGKAARPSPVLYYMALDREDRRALREAQRAVSQRDPVARQDRRAAVVAALRAEPFAPASFEAALAADLASEEIRAATLREALVRKVVAMDPAARAAYARRIEDMTRQDPDKDRGGKRDHAPR